MTVDKSRVSCSAESYWKKKEWQHEHRFHFVQKQLWGKTSKLQICSYTRIKITKTVYGCMVCWSARSPANSENAVFSAWALAFLLHRKQHGKEVVAFPHLTPTLSGCVTLVAGSVSVPVGLAWPTSRFLCYRKSYGSIVFHIFQSPPKETGLTDIFFVVTG